jgi:hypothetical protein
MTACGNPGGLTTSMKACVQSCGEVQFDAKAITNVLKFTTAKHVVD